jgi:hypothetical protein
VPKFVYTLGSLLSELSYSRSEDDVDSNLTQRRNIWKRHRPSLTAGDDTTNSKRRRSTVEKTVEVIQSLWGRVQERISYTHVFKFLLQ